MVVTLAAFGFGRQFSAGPNRTMSSEEQLVREEIAKVGPFQTFSRLIAQNDQIIRGRDLGNGRAIAAARTAIYTELVRHWAAEQQRAFGYDRPFAVVALGGTGRGEMTPCSDNDFAFLFDDAVEGNPFLIELQQQVVNSDRFASQYGFSCLALPFSLDDVTSLSGKQLNSFIDIRQVTTRTNWPSGSENASARPSIRLAISFMSAGFGRISGRRPPVSASTSNGSTSRTTV